MIFNRFPSRGKKIKDATANRNDVKSGRVFYNNSGRQVGTFTDFLTPISLTLRNNTTMKYLPYDCRMGLELNDGKNLLNQIANIFISHEGTLSGYGSSVNNMPLDYVITAITYNGKKYRCYIPACNHGRLEVSFFNNDIFDFSLFIKSNTVEVLFYKSGVNSVSITYSKL